MTTYSRSQVDVFASRAGFTGSSLQTIVAISAAESGWNSSPPDNVNNDIWHSRDRGILQINNHWQPQVSDTCAYDPQCSFNAAYGISNNGTNFNAWSTYQSGAYKQYLLSSPSPGFNAEPNMTFTVNGLQTVTTPIPLKTVDYAIQNSMTNLPGLDGPIVSLDMIEQWQPLKLNDSSGVSYTTSLVPGLKPITLPFDSMQAILVFTVVNTRTALVRGFLIFIGIVIIMAVIQRIMQPATSAALKLVPLMTG